LREKKKFLFLVYQTNNKQRTAAAAAATHTHKLQNQSDEISLLYFGNHLILVESARSQHE
jgi:hypothetical protein